MHILDQPISEVLDVTAREKKDLLAAHIATVRDFLLALPAAYVDTAAPVPIAALEPGMHALVHGTVESIAVKKLFPKKTPYTEAVIRDGTGTLRALWFTHSKAPRAKKGEDARFSGRVHRNKKGGLFFVNPTRIVASASADDSIAPIYPKIRGIPQPLMDAWRDELLAALPPALSDPLPAHVRKKFNLPAFEQAIRYAHRPLTSAWAAAARKRFAFEEMFAIQLHRLQLRRAMETAKTFVVPPAKALADIAALLPFPLTKAQERAVTEILRDMSRAIPMMRLLEGDVGSGKTLVAIIASLAAVRAGFQVAYLAPTEILARQHFAEFCRRLAPFRIRMGLITSAESKSFPSKMRPAEATHISRSQLLSWTRDGTVSVLLGTHAILEEEIQCKNLALAIVDEQHRFGTNQRKALVRRSTQKATQIDAEKNRYMPHMLSMTATPIPRTLALTLYGDLDLSLLDELPPGRKKQITAIVPPEKREQAYEFIRKNIRDGGQAFVICPRIEEHNDDDLPAMSAKPRRVRQAGEKRKETKSVTTEYKKLSEVIFPDLNVAMLHGKQKPKEKEDIIHAFREKNTHILVSTSVIEVGMDIPDASVMMIEGAERFGLASLHQFRGRVGRAGQQAYCFVFTDSRNPKTHERLAALIKAKNGFELAEYDLQLRGPGELSGLSQWGISDLGMEALKNLKMVEAAREEAKKIIEEDPELNAYPLLKERVDQLGEKGIHLE